jgi:hypothetical protein
MLSPATYTLYVRGGPPGPGGGSVGTGGGVPPGGTVLGVVLLVVGFGLVAEEVGFAVGFVPDWTETEPSPHPWATVVMTQLAVKIAQGERKRMVHMFSARDVRMLAPSSMCLRRRRKTAK